MADGIVTVAARKAELQMRRDEAARRADMDSLVVSKESRVNAVQTASSAEAPCGTVTDRPSTSTCSVVDCPGTRKKRQGTFGG